MLQGNEISQKFLLLVWMIVAGMCCIRCLFAFSISTSSRDYGKITSNCGDPVFTCKQVLPYAPSNHVSIRGVQIYSCELLQTLATSVPET